MVCFTKLAIKWPALMRSWEDVEKVLPQIRAELDKGRLAYKIKMISIVVLIISLCISKWLFQWHHDHLMFLLSAEFLLSTIAEISKHTSCRSIEDPMKRLIVAQLPHVFLCTNYNTFKALVAKSINILATFVWSYTDLFLMIISVGISSCFKQINDSLMLHKEKVRRIFEKKKQTKYRS